MKRLRRFWSPWLLLWLLVLPFLWWALKDIPLRDIWKTLSGLSWWQLAALILLNTAIMTLFSSRWWIILRAQGHHLPYPALIGYRLAAFGVSYFTPGPQFGGEPLQVLLTRERHTVPAATAVAAVSLDKLLELIANFTFLVIGLLILLQGGLVHHAPHWSLLAGSLFLFALPGVYLFSLWLGLQPLAWMARGARPGSQPSLLYRLRQGALEAEEQIAHFCRQQPFTLLQAMLLSLLIWIAMVFEYWLTVRFLGTGLNLFQTISLLTATRLAFLLPSPGGLGTLEAGQVLAAQALGLSPALGISISLLIRARDVSLGGLGLWLGASLTQKIAAGRLPAGAGQ